MSSAANGEQDAPVVTEDAVNATRNVENGAAVAVATPTPATNTNGHAGELPSYESGQQQAQAPAYSTRQRTKHVYSLTPNGKTYPCVSLNVLSRAPSSKSLPIFLGGETISGNVDLDLRKTEHIQAISVTLKGETLQVGQEPVPFLKVKQVLWSVEMGDAVPIAPAAPDYTFGSNNSNYPSENTSQSSTDSTTPPPITSSSTSKSNGSKKEGSPKLRGTFTWPFKIEFPEQVEGPLASTSMSPLSKSGAGRSSANHAAAQKLFILPPSFSERGSPAYIDYKLVVTVHKGRFRIDHTLTTSLGYIPQTRAPAPTLLRHLAYIEGPDAQLAGPEADPDGWHVLPSVNVKGMMFETREVEMECTLSIGKPLIYALNTPIPLFITLRQILAPTASYSNVDTQALSLLSSPSSFRIILRRTLSIGLDAIYEDRDLRGDTNFDKEVGRGWVWPVQEKQFRKEPDDNGAREGEEAQVNGSEELNGKGEKDNGIRVLEGEIHIKSSERPSVLFPRFALRHYIDLYPIEAVGFIPSSSTTSTTHSTPVTTTNTTPSSTDSRPLLSQQITLVTLPHSSLSGTLHMRRAPPNYAEPLNTNYGIAIGMLAAANQRFLHVLSTQA